MVSPYVELTVYNPRPGLRTAAEIRRLKTRRQEGAAFGAIFLLLQGSHRRSRRGRRSRPRAARALGGSDAGAAAAPRRPPPPACGRCALGSARRTQLSAAARGPTPPASFPRSPSGPSAAAPGTATLSSPPETLEQFGKVYVALFFFFFLARSVIPLFLD